MPRLVAESSASPAPLVFVHGWLAHRPGGRTRRYLSVATGLGLCNADLRLSWLGTQQRGGNCHAQMARALGESLRESGGSLSTRKRSRGSRRRSAPGGYTHLRTTGRRDNRESAELIEHLEGVVSRSGGRRHGGGALQRRGRGLAGYAVEARPLPQRTVRWNAIWSRPGFLSELTHGTTFGVNPENSHCRGALDAFQLSLLLDARSGPHTRPLAGARPRRML